MLAVCQSGRILPLGDLKRPAEAMLGGATLGFQTWPERTIQPGFA
jgi:hypothetical protein